jgi:hypothetical protein
LPLYLRNGGYVRIALFEYPLGTLCAAEYWNKTVTGNKIAIGLCPVCVHGKTGGLPDLTDAELAARFALLEGLEPPVQEIDIWVDYMHEIPDNYLPFLQHYLAAK